MGLELEISDGNSKEEGVRSALTLLELYEYRSFDLIKVLKTKTRVKDGAARDVKIFLPR
jgi:hypothetical protein